MSIQLMLSLPRSPCVCAGPEVCGCPVSRWAQVSTAHPHHYGHFLDHSRDPSYAVYHHNSSPVSLQYRNYYAPPAQVPYPSLRLPGSSANSSLLTRSAPCTTFQPISEAERIAKEREQLDRLRSDVEHEFDLYIADGIDENINIVPYWDTKQHVYPHIYQVALDILPVQVSAVPCERVFSSSAETCTKRRNNLSPGLFEVLQVLKYVYKQDRLDFCSGWVAREEDYAIDDVTEFALRELLSNNKIDELKDLLQSSRTQDSTIGL